MPRLLLVLLVSLSLSAGEIPVSDLTYIPGDHTQYTRRWPLVIGGGEGFLVLWTEYLFAAYYPTVFGRAYDADGNPLAPMQSFIGARDVVWTGESYFAVDAAEFDGRHPFMFPVPMITIRSFHRDGTPAAPERGHLVGQSGGEVFSVLWDGSHVVALVKVGHKRLLRFHRDGTLVSDTPVDDDVVAIARNGSSLFFLRGTQRRVVLAGEDGRYAVAAAEAVSILDASGAEIDSVPIAARTLSWDGSAWHTAYVDDQQRVCTATFTRSTDVRRDCRVILGASSPAVGAIPRRTLLAWQGANEQIVTASGIASMTYSRQYAFTSAIDATGLLVAWFERGIQLGGLLPDGTRRPQFFIPDTRADRVRIAANGDLSLIVWRAAGEFYAMRLEANGAPLHPILPLGPGFFAHLAPNGEGWLVVQSDAGRLVTTTISRDAVITGQHSLPREDNLSFVPVVAAAGDGFLVATNRGLQRLDRHGVAVGAPTELAGSYPRLACGAHACLVATPSHVALVDHEGRFLRDPRPLSRSGLTDVASRPDGSFRVYTTREIVTIGADGTPRGVMRWTDEAVQWGGVEFFGNRSVFFYVRDGRGYLRALPPRSRAVRH